MTPEEITAAFKAAAEEHPPIEGRLTDDDVLTIKRTSAAICRKAKNYDEVLGKHNLEGVILPEDEYVKKHKEPYKATTRLGLRYTGWKKDAKPSQREIDDKQAVHDAKRLDHNLALAAIEGFKTYVKAIVQEEYYDELEDEVSEYDDVTAQQLLAHLQEGCIGTDDIDALDIPIMMATIYTSATTIRNYAKSMERAQKKSERTRIKVDDISLAAIATKSVKLAGDYPDEMDKWDGKADNEKTWTEWKAHFGLAWKTKDRKERLLNSQTQGQPFGGATPREPAPTNQLYGGIANALDNLSLAATNDTTLLGGVAENQVTIDANLKEMAAAMTSLAKSHDRVTKDNIKLREENNAYRKKLGLKEAEKPTYAEKAAAQAGTTASGIANYGEKGDIKPSFKLEYYKGMPYPTTWRRGFWCWSCGFGTTHNSPDCKWQADGHKKEATRSNNMGGSTRNKGWEA
jgi:uncharacterized protein YfeS